MSEDHPWSDRRGPDGADAPRTVDDAVEQEWVEETTAFERVNTVLRRTYRPESSERRSTTR